MTTVTPAPSPAAVQLRRIRWVAVVDLVLLVPLLVGVLTDNHQLAPVIGPLHGVAFVTEVYLALAGAGEGRWGWWYPVVILATGGPPGAFFGHRRAEREAVGR